MLLLNSFLSVFLCLVFCLSCIEAKEKVTKLALKSASKSASKPASKPGQETVKKLYPLSIAWIGDFHARLQETNEQSTDCQPGEKCIGGYARGVTVLKGLLKKRKNVIYLNSGDNFKGVLWYMIGRWKVIAHFMNLLPAHAMVWGNHDFEYFEDCLPFTKAVKTPMVVANVDDSKEPSFKNKYQKSIVIERSGRKIGIIGVIIKNVNEIADTGKLTFIDESEAIKAEIPKLKSQGVNIIIVLSHCGLDVDYKIAKNVGSDIDIIIGGHSHSFMYTGDDPPGPDTVVGKYPAIVDHKDGGKTLIVHASCYMKYVGDLTTYFDENGRVQKWEGAPIYLDTEIKQDKQVVEELKKWQVEIDKGGSEVVGRTRTKLSNEYCKSKECAIANMFADAFVNHYATKMPCPRGQWTESSIALVLGYKIRSSIVSTEITMKDLLNIMPFGSTYDAVDLTGAQLKEILEFSVGWDTKKESSSKTMLQVSGLKIVYDMTKKAGKRVVSVQVLSTKDKNYELLDPAKKYRVLVSSFLAEGGGGFKLIKQNMRKHKKGPSAFDMVLDYLKSNKDKPINAKTSGRITI